MPGITLAQGRAYACRVVLLVVVVLTMALAATAHATPATVGPPHSIDALGDSITRGYDSQGSGCGSFADCPANSWATGSNAGVNSYFNRVKALNPSVVLARPVKSSTEGGNDAVTGAKMANLLSQAENAVAAPNKPDEVLVLMGANDVCTSSEASMTSVTSFRSSLIAGMNKLSSGLPDARIDIASIPNIYNLWKVLHTNLAAQLTWGLAKICQSMLLNPSSTSTSDENRRLNVKKRNEEFNVVIKEVCATYIHCHYDNGAAFKVEFASSEVSTLDYFHPNTNGQAKAAATEFGAGPSFTDLTAPSTTIARDRPAEGVDDWYRAPVTVTISASDNNDPVAGSEYFYKLEGSENTAWIKYEGPISVTSEGPLGRLQRQHLGNQDRRDQDRRGQTDVHARLPERTGAAEQRSGLHDLGGERHALRIRRQPERDVPDRHVKSGFLQQHGADRRQGRQHDDPRMHDRRRLPRSRHTRALVGLEPQHGLLQPRLDGVGRSAALPVAAVHAAAPQRERRMDRSQQRARRTLLLVRHRTARDRGHVALPRDGARRLARDGLLAGL
jgi:lysophospholipase L1-like esterase